MKPIFRFLSVVIWLLFFSFLTVQAQTYDWTLSGSSNRFDEILCIASGIDGNIYASGQSIAPFVKIDTLVGTDTTIIQIDTLYSPDILLAAFTADGNLIWQQTLEGKGNDRATHIAATTEGNFFVAGSFSDTLSFGDTQLSTSSKFNSDIFTALFNSAGTKQWVAQIGGKGNAFSAGLSTDSDGNAFVGFNFSDTISIQSDLIVAAPAAANFAIVKYNNEGGVEWYRMGSNNSGITLTSLNTDAEGNTFAVGYFSGYISFGDIYIGSYDELDGFIAKINTSGIVEWLTTMPYLGNQSFHSVATGGNNELYVCGQTNEPIPLNNDTIPISGINSTFIVRYTKDNGTLQWITPINGQGVSFAQQVSVDADGNAWIAGSFSPSIFNNSDTLYSQGSEDILLAKVNPEGGLQWLHTAGSVYSEKANTLTFDSDNNLYFAGAFEVETVFVPDTLYSLGEYDYFLAKIGTSIVTHLPDNFLNPSVQTQELTLSVFPNPANNFATVVLPNTKESLQLTLCDLNGVVLTQTILNGQSPTFNLELSDLPHGLYLLHAATASQSKVIKLTVW